MTARPKPFFTIGDSRLTAPPALRYIGDGDEGASFFFCRGQEASTINHSNKIGWFVVLVLLGTSAGAAAQSGSGQTWLDDYKARSVSEMLPEQKTESVPLDAVLKTARTQSPAVQRARARLFEGEARVEGTRMLTRYNPVISAGVEQFRFGDSDSGEAKVGISQRFSVAGEQAARETTAEKYRQVLQQRLERTRWAVHTDIHRLYNLARVDVRRLQLHLQLRGFFADLKEIAELRLEAGETNRIALQVSKVELARAKQDVVRSRSTLVSRLRTLQQRAGLEPEALPVPTGSVPDPRTNLDAAELRESAQTSHPLVEVYQAVVQRAESEVDYQTKKAWPDPTLGLFYKTRSPGPDTRDHGVVAQLSVPVPLWNANKLEREASKAKRRVARTNLSTIRRELKPKVSDAVQSVESAARQITIFGEELVPAFERELELLRQGYEAGEFDITDVTVAQRRLLEGRQQALDATASYVESAAQLERLTGLEFWKETP